MATISKITTTYIDGTTIITSSLLGEFKSKINDIIDELNSSSTPTPVSNVTISTSVTPTGSGSVTGGGSYAPGASVTLTATAASGYTFSSWSDGNTNATRSITVGNSNQTYTATFAAISTPIVAAPTITIAGNSCTMSAENGATIYYTLNDSAPTTSSTQYSSAITLQSACTVKAIAVKNGVQSSVATQTYTPSQSYDSDTEAIANRFSNITTAKKNALDTFVRSLKSSGVYSKIDYLALPAIADNVTEATQNALGGEGVVVNGTSVALSNNGLSPIIGEEQMLIDNLSTDSANTHISFFTNNAATPVSGKWDVALCFDNLFGFGKAINAASPGLYYMNSENSAIRWVPTELATYKTTALTHVIAVSASTKVALSLNGTYVEQSDSVKASSYQSNRMYFGQASGISSHVYQAQDSEGSFGGITAFKYGLISKGKALSQTECIAFNNAVTTFMNSILG